MRSEIWNLLLLEIYFLDNTGWWINGDALSIWFIASHCTFQTQLPSTLCFNVISCFNVALINKIEWYIMQYFSRKISLYTKCQERAYLVIYGLYTTNVKFDDVPREYYQSPDTETRRDGWSCTHVIVTFFVYILYISNSLPLYNVSFVFSRALRAVVGRVRLLCLKIPSAFPSNVSCILKYNTVSMFF